MQPPSPTQPPVQAPEYAQPLPYGPPPPYPYYPQPPRKNRLPLIIILVVVAVVAVVGGTAAFLLRGPSMAITNFQLVDQRSCSTFGSGNGNVLVTYDLVNTAGTGFATIAYLLDGATDHTNQYHVAGGGTLPVQDSVFVPDCNAHDVSAQIVSQTAG